MRRSRSVLAAVSTAWRAASSHELLLLPITSVTRYTPPAPFLAMVSSCGRWGICCATILYAGRAPPIARDPAALALHARPVPLQHDVHRAVAVGAHEGGLRGAVALQHLAAGMTETAAIAHRHHRPARRDRGDELAAGRG